MAIPKKIVSLLEKSTVCFLATSLHDQPHLSLMNFTFLPSEELLILSSRKDTKKFHNILNNPQAALLVYETDPGQEPLSCTIFGRINIESGEKEAYYRSLHANQNQAMSQFITGPSIYIMTMKIEQAAVTDLADKVFKWDTV